MFFFSARKTINDLNKKFIFLLKKCLNYARKQYDFYLIQNLKNNIEAKLLNIYYTINKKYFSIRCNNSSLRFILLLKLILKTISRNNTKRWSLFFWLKSLFFITNLLKPLTYDSTDFKTLCMVLSTNQIN